VMQGGTLIVAGPFSVNGNTVAHGSGGTGAGDGSEFGAGLFLQGNGTVTFNPGASETQAIDDAIADQTGSGGTGANAGSYALVKTGDGTLELNAPNTYSGGTTLNGGTLKFGADNAFGTGTLTVLGSTLTAASFMAIGNAIDLKGNLTVLVDAADTTTLTGGIGDTGGAFGITKTGGGTLSLFGASTYTGDTIVKAGILLAGSAQGFSSASAFKVAAGATLDINGKAVTLGSLADSGAAGGTVTNADTIDEILTIGADNTSTAFSGVIQDGVHSIELKKIGTGTQILSGANTYSLGTTVAGGKLQVDGSITSAVTVASGGTLGGRGSTGAVTVQSGGTLAPGASPGVLSTGNVALAAGATFAIELAGTSPGVGGHDQVKVTGTVNLGGATLDGDVLPGFVPSVGDSFTIIDNDGADAVAGTFAGLAEGDYFVLDQRAMTITYHGGDGNDVVLTATAATIIGTSGPDLVDATHTVAGQALPTDGDDLINGLGGKDTLSGLEGDDTILGGKANDTLHGDEGDDTINGGKGKDKAFGGDGDDAIAGGGGNDRLKGDAGADTLDGGPGKDKLTGGADDDTFVFANPNRPDKVTDMSDGDMIALKKSAFPGIGPKGTLDADAFHVGFTASSPAQKIVYNQHSGWLEWYRHGSHTTDPVAFAKIGKHLDFLDHADFIVI
ncbi:MAG: autotransporter-associated beta strand repeat-containing protein, partial [Bauldia sp.]|nr:autotransporter-associated beta strand repeat-containing protein [Bauldia sp.]